MRYMDLLKIKKLYFSARDLAGCLDINYASAKVTCARYVKAGLITRIKRNFYMLRDRWANLSAEEQFSVANILQVPSYVSLTTALSYYDISTQIQRDFVESISVKRTKAINVKDRQFYFFKIKGLYYDNFIKKDNFFVATPEKALVDGIYLMALGKYKLDISAIDFEKLDRNKVIKMLKRYPGRVRKLGEGLWRR